MIGSLDYQNEEVASVIELSHVSKHFQGQDGPFKAVDDITLTVKANEIFGVIGESGAGKSTLLRFMNALEQPDEGQVKVDGVSVQDLSSTALRTFRKDIGMVFQQFNLLDNKTVVENIRLPLELHPYTGTLSVEEVLDFVGLSDKRDYYPSQLSGGQKQRVGIARALITQPKLLLCDEPTSALDANMRDEIVAVLAKAHQKFGTTIVIVTHELEVIKALCHRAAIMDSGKLVDVIDITRTEEIKTIKSYHQRVLEVLSHD